MTSDAPPIRQLSAPDLKAMLEGGTAVELVDVRTHEERALAAIEGSRLLDQAYHDALLLRDRDTPLVFQCHHGVRSSTPPSTSGNRGSAISTTCAAASTPGRCSSIRPYHATERPARRQTPGGRHSSPHRLRRAVIDIARARSSLDVSDHRQRPARHVRAIPDRPQALAADGSNRLCG